MKVHILIYERWRDLDVSFATSAKEKGPGFAIPHCLRGHLLHPFEAGA